MGTTKTRHSIWTPWLLGWVGMLALAMANGTLRAALTQPLLGETVARALATVILLAALTGYVWWLHGRWPIPVARQAWAIGFAWVTMTLVFEFGWGGLVEGLSWSTMLADYNLTAGRIWVLVPIWTVMAPAIIGRYRAARQDRQARVR